jgi:hypothetical protein
LALLAAFPASAQSRFNRLSALVAEGLADQGFWRINPGAVKPPPVRDGGAVTAKMLFQSRMARTDLEALGCDALLGHVRSRQTA